jgi:hypothetical protein
MEAFNIKVALTTGYTTLKVLPFKYITDISNAAYYLFLDYVEVGAICIGDEYSWVSFVELLWCSDDIERIGYQIERHCS